MKYIIIFALLSFYSCMKPVYIEKVRTETVNVVETVRDTIIDLKIEKEYIENTIDITKDSTSKLLTKYAESLAQVLNGKLYHTLSNKDTIPNAVVPIKVITKTKTITIKEPYPVIKYKISGWSYTIAIISLLTLLLFMRFR